MFFFVSQRPGQAVSFEPQFIAGYALKEGSKVSVAIGDKKFTMFTKGKSAWVENAAEEPLLIAAMKSGDDMKVQAQSGRGTKTSYAFSLKGISAALDSIQAANRRSQRSDVRPGRRRPALSFGRKLQTGSTATP